MEESSYASLRPVKQSILKTTILNPFTYTAIGGVAAFANPSGTAEALSSNVKGIKIAGAVIAGVSLLAVGLKAFAEHRVQDTLQKLDNENNMLASNSRQEQKWVDKVQSNNNSNLYENSR